MSYASDPCNSRFTTWVAVKHGGSELGKAVVAQDYDALAQQLAASQVEVNRLQNACDKQFAATIRLGRQLAASEAYADEGWALSAERGMRNARLEAELAARDIRLAEAVRVITNLAVEAMSVPGFHIKHVRDARAFLSGEEK